MLMNQTDAEAARGSYRDDSDNQCCSTNIQNSALPGNAGVSRSMLSVPNALLVNPEMFRVRWSSYCGHAFRIGDAIANSESTFSSDDDPQLVRDAVPFSLKLIESLLSET